MGKKQGAPIANANDTNRGGMTGLSEQEEAKEPPDSTKERMQDALHIDEHLQQDASQHPESTKAATVAKKPVIATEDTKVTNATDSSDEEEDDRFNTRLNWIHTTDPLHKIKIRCRLSDGDKQVPGLPSMQLGAANLGSLNDNAIFFFNNEWRTVLARASISFFRNKLIERNMRERTTFALDCFTEIVTTNNRECISFALFEDSDIRLPPGTIADNITDVTDIHDASRGPSQTLQYSVVFTGIAGRSLHQLFNPDLDDHDFASVFSDLSDKSPIKTFQRYGISISPSSLQSNTAPAVTTTRGTQPGLETPVQQQNCLSALSKECTKRTSSHRRSRSHNS